MSTKQKESAIYSANFIKQMDMGDTVNIRKSLVDTLERTGKTGRNMQHWYNIVEVIVDGELCELHYYDRGGVHLQRGSNL